MSLELFFFRKKKQLLLNFAFFFFVYLLPGFINETSHNTLSVLKEGGIEHMFKGKIMALRLRKRFLSKFN